MLAINNLTEKKKEIDEKLLLKIAEKVLEKEKIKVRINLSIALVSSAEIKKLNNKYRGKNKPTDVLSFGEIKKTKKQFDFFEPEIIICLKEVEKNAKQSKEPFKKELIRVLIHAILHLLGFEHEQGGLAAEKMIKKQEKYLSLFKF
ncbi:MAG: rRNA maturation RNase YbeY [Candidatus Paceibacterota bacterium]|jgi:probable rRNA maturation factor